MIHYMTARPDVEEELWTVAEVQARFRISRSTAYELARKHGFRVGKLLRVRKTRLLNFIESQEGGTT